jgi:IS5 family transposase
MQTKANPQLGLMDSLVTIPANDFLDRLEQLVDWRPLERVLHALYPATTGRPPHPPLVLFKMSLLQHCYDLSDPQCEEQVRDRLSWRRCVGLGLQDAVPDETVLVRFRQRLMEHGLQEKLLQLVNRQLSAQGLILKRVTLVDATLVQAARRAPAQADPHGGDGDAGFTVKRGTPHYGYKAHVSVDEEHTLIRQATLTAANVHDSREFATVVRGDEQMVVADKAYASAERRAWLARRGIHDGLLHRATRGHPLGEPCRQMNRFLSGVRSRIEKIFGHWKRSLGYRRVRYVGREPNRLELEFKCVVWNLKRWVNVSAA